VTVLGTSSPYPRPDDPCSSFLLDAGVTRLWVDTGAGTLGALLRHTPLEDLDAVWVSHTHADHFSDLAVTYYALRFADIDRPPLPVYGPPGWGERLRASLSHGVPSPIERAFEVHEVDDGTHLTVGDLELTARAVRHDVPCVGFRATGPDGTVAYTGDSGPCDALHELAADVDLLVSEAGYGMDDADPEGVHLTAGEAGALAAAAGVRWLLLTHLAGADVDGCVRAATQAGQAATTGARPGMILHAGTGRPPTTA
jgi:ribonuclease BN (tRNA processing enzyme)